MRIQIISDLHIDMISGAENFARLLEPAPDIDCLIIAGDIGFGIRNRFRRFIKYCSEKFKHTYFVLGNHEFYDIKRRYTMADQKRRIRCVIQHYANVRLLDNDAAIMNGFVILGTTLWSRPLDCLKYEINDYNYIKIRPDLELNPADVRDFHQRNVAWLESKLLDHKDKDVIVISHHVPSFKLLKQANNLASAFASCCENLIHSNPNLKLWIFGHSHDSVDEQINQCRCVSNGGVSCATRFIIDVSHVT